MPRQNAAPANAWPARMAIGARVELDSDLTDFDPIVKGERGTVKYIDAWSVDVAWDNGRTLSLLADVDQFTIL